MDRWDWDGNPHYDSYLVMQEHKNLLSSGHAEMLEGDVESDDWLNGFYDWFAPLSDCYEVSAEIG